MAKKKAKREKKANWKRDQKIKKAMGTLRYFICPCIRFMYDPDDDRGLTEEQKKERDEKRRADELATKNPETAHWKQMERRIDPNKGGSESYVIDKVLKTERHREARTTGRADRRAERKADEGLAHKFRTMGAGLDIM